MSKTMVAIRWDRELKAAADGEAQRRGITFSDFVRETVRIEIQRGRPDEESAG